VPRFVYLDYAATTPVAPAVVEEMLPWLGLQFGNPSSLYEIGVEAAGALDLARRRVAELIGASDEEIYFTSGATEANNWVVQSIVRAPKTRGRHLLVSAIEHHSLLDPALMLQRYRQAEVTLLPVDRFGLVDPDTVRRYLRADTALVAVMFANNEIGTIEPVEEIGKIVREHGARFHVDAVQAAGKIELDVNRIGCDFMSLSAHKIYGPKGVGALYLRRGVKLPPLMQGGNQENKRRAGTQNVPGIVGFGKAAQIARQQREPEAKRLLALRDHLWQALEHGVAGLIFTGHPTQRLPNSVSFCAPGAQGETMVLDLAMQGVYASTASACAAGSTDPSHVLLACGFPPDVAYGSLRLTLGRYTTEEDIAYVASVLPEIVQRHRALVPTT